MIDSGLFFGPPCSCDDFARNWSLDAMNRRWYPILCVPLRIRIGHTKPKPNTCNLLNKTSQASKTHMLWGDFACPEKWEHRSLATIPWLVQMRYFVAQGTAGRQLIFWRVKLMFLIHIFKKYVIIHLVDRRSVLLGLYLKFFCVREGELYLPDSFL